MYARLSIALGRQLAAETDLSLQDYGVLALLSEHPDGRMRIMELAQALGWEKSRISHHLSRMERRGLVSREACPADRRGSFAAITPQGLEAIRRAAPGHVEAVRRWFVEPLGKDGLRAMTRLAESVISAVGNEESEA
ncbi:MAG: MarR family transcriptional regulator [Acidimicrobiales bacterium]|nr:MAG: MarR family transcriptional regulator [Acidimicrobiales bacterium]